jgi:polyisoprenyl-teichoic acid--peptidoglycan teichoic acid transferase
VYVSGVEKTGAVKRRGSLVGLWVVIIAVITVVGVALGYMFWVSQETMDSFDESEVITDAFPDDEFRPPPGVEGSVTILLLGSDTRGQITSLADASGDRSDAMILVRISGDREHVTMMSIMRDSWVTIPGFGENKVNAALAFGGVSLAVQTVEELVGVRVDHVAVVDFAGFAALTDALGGVTVNNQRAFTPGELPGASFARGEITLNGEEALAYVRERSAFATGDFQRVANQRAFLTGVMATLLDRGALASPAETKRIVDSLSPHIARDPNLTSEVILGVANSLKGITPDSVSSFTMPTTGTGTISGQSVVLVNADELAVVTEKLVADTIHTYTQQ